MADSTAAGHHEVEDESDPLVVAISTAMKPLTEGLRLLNEMERTLKAIIREIDDTIKVLDTPFS